MTISTSFSRPAATLTKLIKRLVLTPSYSGINLNIGVIEYVFAGNVANYVSSTSPANSTASSSTSYTLRATDMDAFHTAAGDARS